MTGKYFIGTFIVIPTDQMVAMLAVLAALYDMHLFAFSGRAGKASSAPIRR